MSKPAAPSVKSPLRLNRETLKNLHARTGLRTGMAPGASADCASANCVVSGGCGYGTNGCAASNGCALATKACTSLLA